LPIGVATTQSFPAGRSGIMEPILREAPCQHYVYRAY